VLEDVETGQVTAFTAYYLKPLLRLVRLGEPGSMDGRKAYGPDRSTSCRPREGR